LGAGFFYASKKPEKRLNVLKNGLGEFQKLVRRVLKAE